MTIAPLSKRKADILVTTKDTTDKLQMTSTNCSYGLFGGVLKLVLVDVLIMVCHYSFSLYRASSAVVVANLIDANMLVINMWNQHIVMQASLNSMIIWKNNTSIMNMSPQNAYRMQSNIFANDVIAAYQKYASYDYGTYTSVFRSFFGASSLCSRLLNNSKHIFNYCGTGDTSYMSQDLVISLKNIHSILDEAADLARMNMNTSSLLHNPKLQAYQAYALISILFSDIYYMLILPLTASLASYINPSIYATSSQSSTSSLTVFFYLFLPALIIYSILLHMLVIKKYNQTMIYYWTTPKLIPVTIIEKNAWLHYFFKKVLAGSHKFIIF